MGGEIGGGFTLYYRENCHLCESMRLAMTRLARDRAFTWQEVDVDRDIDLIRRYDSLVPVLCHAGEEVCHHFFDESAVTRLLGHDG